MILMINLALIAEHLAHFSGSVFLPRMKHSYVTNETSDTPTTAIGPLIYSRILSGIR